MKLLKILILFFISLFTISNVYASSDFLIIKKYGNIIVRIESGYPYEEINKALIIGQLAEKLSRKLKYTKTIFVDFKHSYARNCETDYFISFDKGKTFGNNFVDGKPEPNFLKENSIVIRQAGITFDCEKTLKLTEYAIENLVVIVKKQKMISYSKNYRLMIINTIDSKLLTKILTLPPSKFVKETMNAAITISNQDGISYYFKNNLFYVFFKTQNIKREIIKLDKIYYIKKIDVDTQILFDTPKSFYYIHKDKISKKHLIPTPKLSFSLYDIQKVQRDKISFFYYYTILTANKNGPSQSIKREYIYSISKDELVCK